MSIKKFKKDGLIFREGLCSRKGKELEVSGFKLPKLTKESEKTFLKLKLGYKLNVVPLGAEGSDSDSAGGDEAAFKKIKASVGKEIKKELAGGNADKNRITQMVKDATKKEQQADYAGATAVFEEIQSIIKGGGGGPLTPERREKMVQDLSEMEKNIDKIMKALEK